MLKDCVPGIHNYKFMVTQFRQIVKADVRREMLTGNAQFLLYVFDVIG